MEFESRIMGEMIAYYGNDVKRINHFLKVYGFAKTIGLLEQIDENRQHKLCIAAIVHDIGIKVSEEKYNSSSGKYQQIEGPPLAKALLENLGCHEDIVSRVCHIVGHHHSYHLIDDLDFQILVEADFLVNIFEDGLSGELVKNIRDKYFKTETGIKLIETMYLD